MLVELRGVTKSFGPVRALSDLTADIEGQVIGLLGPNGAGKSTLLRLLLGLSSFDGHARVLGRDPRTDSLAIRDRVGYMPESDSYLPFMNAVDLCAYGAELSGLPRAEAMERAHAALHYANLMDKRYLPLDGYSTGMKQRVKLAQAVVHDPELLFLDEPTNGLDPQGRDELLDLIRELPRRRGASVILSTHLLPDVERICDAVVVMAQGRLRFSGSLEELRGEGSGQVFVVRVKRRVPAFEEALVQGGCQVDPGRDALSVTLPAGAAASLVLETARQHGAQVRHLVPHKATLEDAFLRRIDAA